MTTRRAKTLIAITIFAGALLSAPKSSVADTTPQSCHDGYTLLNAKNYDGAIRALNRCLSKRSLGKQSKANAFFNRATSFYFQGLGILDDDSKKWEIADDYFEKAMADVEKSIDIDPANAADGYCLRGHIWLEFTWGMEGWDDLEKGKAMGASEERC